MEKGVFADSSCAVSGIRVCFQEKDNLYPAFMRKRQRVERAFPAFVAS